MLNSEMGIGEIYEEKNHLITCNSRHDATFIVNCFFSDLKIDGKGE